MSVVTQIEEAGPCRLKVTIEVPAPAVDAEMGRVVQDFRKQINLPGFRKGKVPMGVIKKRFKDEIHNELAERLLPRYWRQAQAEKDLDPLLPPTVEELEIEDGQPMKVVAAIETRPEIALGDVENFDVPSENPGATEPEIEDALAELRKSMAKWETVDRPSAQGDMVVGTAVREVIGGEDADDADSDSDAAAEGDDEEPSVEARPIQIEIGADNVDEELSLELTGKSAGQKVTFETEEGEEGSKVPVRYEIEVVEVKERELPELTDEMAQQVGPFETADDLRRRVEENITQNKTQELNQKKRGALMEQLRERHPLALPEGVVQQETERMMREFVQHVSGQGVDVENANIDFASLAEDLRPQAEKRVHDRLILDAIAKEKKIRLDESRFEEFLARVAEDQNTNSLAVRQRLAEDGRLEPLRAQMLRDQTVGILLGEDPSSEEGDDGEKTDGGSDSASDSETDSATTDAGSNEEE